MKRYADSAWDDEMVKNLTQLHAEGFSFSEIARALGHGLTRSACIGKRNRLGLPLRRAPKTTAEKYVRDYKKESDARRIRKLSPHTPPSNNRPRLRLAPGSRTLVEMTDYDIVPIRELTAAAIPIEQRVSLMQLSHHHCRFPYGDPKSPDFFFCGGKKHRGAYCAYHAQISYHNPPRLTNQERERLRQLRVTAAKLSIEQNRAVG